MAIRTSGVGASRKLEFWDQYGVKKYDFSPTEMLTPGPVLFELEHILLTDTDVTPVGNVLLKVLDKVPYFRDEADAIDIVLPEVDIPHHLVDAVELDSLLTLNAGAIMAGAWPLATLDMNGNNIDGAGRLMGVAGGELFIGPGDSSYWTELSGGLGNMEGGSLWVYGKDDGTYPDSVVLTTPNTAHVGKVVRFRLYGGADADVDGLWSNVLHKGLKLGNAMDANSMKIGGLGAPVAQDDALRYDRAEIRNEEIAATYMKVATGALVSVNGINSKIFSWQNTAVGVAVIVHKVLVDITTPSTVPAKINVGQAATEVESYDLIHDGELRYVGVLSSIFDKGSYGKGAQHVNDGEWITGWEGSIADPADLVGKYYIYYTQVAA